MVEAPIWGLLSAACAIFGVACALGMYIQEIRNHEKIEKLQKEIELLKELRKGFSPIGKTRSLRTI